MRISFLSLALVSVLSSIPLAASSLGECSSPGGSPSLGEMEIGDGAAGGTFYLDDRGYALGNGLWLYQESNGIFTPHAPVGVGPGQPHVTYWWTWLIIDSGDAGRDLQRGGSSPYVPDDHEICTDDPSVVPDTFFF